MRRPSAALVLFCFAIFGCSHKESDPYALTPGPMQVWARKQPSIDKDDLRNASEFALASNALAFKLFAACNKAGDNELISPLSISMSLAMLGSAARGQTQTDIYKTLNSPGGEKAVSENVNSMMLELHQPPDSPVVITNSVWLARPHKAEATFLATLEHNFGGKATSLDSVKQINDWASQSTNGMIDHVVDSIDSNTNAILASAALFQAHWETEFDPEKTGSIPFKLPDGKQIYVMAMSRSAGFESCNLKGANFLKLPYKAHDYAMLLILPEKGSPEEFLKGQSWESWGEILGGLQSQHLELQLPKMRFRTHVDLNDPLAKIGLSSLFRNADFSGLSSDLENDAIGDSFHDTFIEVTEQGTRAAAVTRHAIAGARIAGHEFHLDRPFAFAIYHVPTNAILFLGVCNDPSKLGGGAPESSGPHVFISQQ